MSDAMKSVRYSFMGLRNATRTFGHNKNKQIIIDRIDLLIVALLQFKKILKENE